MLKQDNKETKTLNKILCLGLGNFAQNPHLSAQIASKFQLSFLLALLKTSTVQENQVTVQLFDPLFTVCEREILTNLGLETSEENLEGRYSCSENHLTLFYLPHCPKQLTNNILWSNWDQLENVVIIGNSINSCILNLSERQLQDITYLKKASEFVQGE